MVGQGQRVEKDPSKRVRKAERMRRVVAKREENKRLRGERRILRKEAEARGEKVTREMPKSFEQRVVFDEAVVDDSAPLEHHEALWVEANDEFSAYLDQEAPKRLKRKELKRMLARPLEVLEAEARAKLEQAELEQAANNETADTDTALPDTIHENAETKHTDSVSEASEATSSGGEEDEAASHGDASPQEASSSSGDEVGCESDDEEYDEENSDENSGEESDDDDEEFGAGPEDELGNLSKEKPEAKDETEMKIEQKEEVASTVDGLLTSDDDEAAAPPRLLPKILLTTCSENLTKQTKKLFRDLQAVLPETFYLARENRSTAEVLEFCLSRDYTDVMIFEQTRLKGATGVFITHLPEGPSSYYKIRNVKLGKEVDAKLTFTTHYPEVILKNFNTAVGRRLQRQLQCLVPAKAEFEGRRVLAFINKFDFIFFRHYKYVFEDTGEKCRLVEIGPKITFRPEWMAEGLLDMDCQKYEWQCKERHRVTNRFLHYV